MSEKKSQPSDGFTSSEPENKRELDKIPRLTKQELLEVSQNISLYYAPRVSMKDKKLVLLSVDPQQLHAYWDLGENREKNSSPDPSKNGLVLRVYSQEDNGNTVKSKRVLDLTIQRSQSKQTINLPISKTRKTYFARIGELNSGDRFTPLVSSNNTNSVSKKEKFINKVIVNHYIDDTKEEYDFVDKEDVQQEQLKSNYSSYIHLNNSGIGYQHL